MTPKHRKLLFAVSITALLSGCGSPNNSHRLDWSDVPQDIQKVVTDNADGYEILSVNREYADANHMQYCVRYKGDAGMRRVVKIAESGRVLSTREESKEVIVAWVQVPEPAQDAIHEQAKGETIGKVTQQTIDGKTYYTAKVHNSDGTKRIIRVDEDGNVLKAKVTIG